MPHALANEKPASLLLQVFLKDELKYVEKIIHQHNPEAPLLMDVMFQHLMSGRGKRTRPLLVLAISHLISGISANAHALAAAIELIHAATLMHDDVVDEAQLRRHKETMHTRFGNKMSILFGDFLLSQAFRCMLIPQNLEAVRIISETCALMAQGEIRQLTARNQWQTTYDQYEQVIFEKTATLFTVACQLGGIAGQASDSQQALLTTMGKHIGLSFQIIDDIIDYRLASHDKTPGRDFFDGKVTLPVIYAIQNNHDIEFWKHVFSKEERDQTDLSIALEKLNICGAFDYSRQVAHEHAQKAVNCLYQLSGPCEMRDMIEQFIYDLQTRPQ